MLNPAINFSNAIFTSALSTGASDIHFYPFANRTNIYFRVHGDRVFYKEIMKAQYNLLLTYFKFSSGMDIGEIRKPQNGTLIYQDTTEKYSLRLSTLPVNDNESLAIRILPQENELQLDELFLFPNQFKKVKNWIANQSGIILFSGPTGSGKSTTLYALLHSILQKRSYQMITLEDPIEKNIHNVLQVQINKKAGITYQSGLKAVLRHDPDIIMVGEVRDKETAQFSFEASLTGHLVLSTLHAKSAIGSVERLLDMGIKRIDLKQSLLAIASIQLVPIQINEQITRRAAILELLDGEILKKYLNGNKIDELVTFHNFKHLRKKAYAYGFISKETYQNSS